MAQERYYDQMLDRCLGLGKSATSGDDLNEAFQGLQVSDDAETNVSSEDEATVSKESRILSSIREHEQTDSKDLSVIVQAMRKLREAFVATDRDDLFACRAYVFIVRATILLRHPESYHPALLHCLRRMHRQTSLKDDTMKQMMGFQVLDLACRQENWQMAFQSCYQYGLRGSHVDLLLRALLHGDWVRFARVRSSLEVYQQRLTESATDPLMKHAALCVGKSYLQIEKSYFDRAFGKTWEVLREELTLPWTLQGGNVIVRQTKR